MKDIKIYFNGNWRRTKTAIPVFNPYSNEELGEVYETGKDDFDAVIKSSESGFLEMKSLPAYKKSEFLLRCSLLLKERAQEFSEIITQESGKAIKYSRSEVFRASENFRFASEVIKHFKGSVLKGDASAGGIGRRLIFERFPLGVVAAITPFNFPLNLVVHKVAPALAAGNSVILKPSSYTPITAVKLIEVLLESGFPPHAVNLVIGRGDIVGNWINSSSSIRMITFTGSPETGNTIKAQSGLKKVALELGSNSPVIIDEIKDIDNLTSRLITGVCANSGQVCISVQRIYVRDELYEELKESLVAGLNKVVVGDPADEKVEYGPMINEREAVRIENSIKQAVSQGANILAGGTRYKSIIQPTLIENVNMEMDVYSKEIFGPVACLIKYSDFDQVLNETNRSEFGLNAGVFTSDINKMLKAYRELETGGVIINDIPTWRIDNMPYGGVKNSGIGREGTEFALEEMTEIKLLVINEEY
ncbi:MAG TPA: aldehyde dehydrogenase family protein [Firmicutes bacterium]|nr:aldehyde dehydrogenase family protein [Bacillota bacterium]